MRSERFLWRALLDPGMGLADAYVEVVIDTMIITISIIVIHINVYIISIIIISSSSSSSSSTLH